MNKITNLDEYLEAERQADELYEKPHMQEKLNLILEQMSLYEDENPDQLSRLYGDSTNLLDETSETDNGFDYPCDFKEDY